MWKDFSVSVAMAVKDSLTYEAENLYLNQNTSGPLLPFLTVLTLLNKTKLNASFYRLVCLTKSLDLCVEDYAQVLEYPDNAFTERALADWLESVLKNKYGSAAFHYARLLEIAQTTI